MEQTELMEKMAMMQRVSQLHRQWLVQLVLKESVVKKVVMEFLDQVVQLERPELLEQQELRDQQVLQVVVRQDRKVQQVQMEVMVRQVVLVREEKQERLVHLK
jgi:hypothetical protein